MELNPQPVMFIDRRRTAWAPVVVNKRVTLNATDCEHAIPPVFGSKWVTECLNTTYSVPTLLRAGYGVKLNKKKEKRFTMDNNMNTTIIFVFPLWHAKCGVKLRQTKVENGIIYNEYLHAFKFTKCKRKYRNIQIS